MVIKKKRILLFCLVGVASILLHYIYSSWAVDAYGYQGMMPVHADILGLVVNLVLLTITVYSLPLQIREPVDFYYLFYSWFVLFPFAVLYGSSGYIDAIDAFVVYFLLSFPLFIVRLLGGVAIGTPTIPLLKESTLIFSVIVFSLIVFVLTYFQGIRFSFDFDSMYERRLIGRDVIGSRNILAYALNACVNGFSPLLALLGGIKRNPLIGGIGLAIALTGFAAIGTKSPIFLAVLFFVIGWMQLKNITEKMSIMFSVLIVGIFIAGILEFNYSEHWFIYDFLIRRAFLSASVNIGFYWDLISGFSMPEIFSGGHNSDGAITFLVGERYYGNAETNVNINAFLLALANGGVVFYLFSICAVGLFFAELGARFRKTEYVGYILLAAIFGLLLTEQAWTTALISSGVLLIFILLSSVRRDRNFS